MLTLLSTYPVKGFYPKWTSETIQSPISEWAVSEINVMFLFLYYQTSAKYII